MRHSSLLLASLLLLLTACASSSSSGGLRAQRWSREDVPSLRHMAEMQDRFTLERFEDELPRLMREAGVDLWIVLAREYAEDPVLETMLPADWMSARRTTILVLHDTGSRVERHAVSRYPVGEFFASAWNPEEEPDQWLALARLVESCGPERIALDVSETSALADGLTSSQHQALLAGLGPELRGRIVTGTELPLRWLGATTRGERETYPSIVALAHDVMHEGLAWITPGSTTTADLSWWYRERLRELGLGTWFHPLASVQRRSGTSGTALPDEETTRVIRPGDLLHIDVGIVYAGLHTDIQHQAYVLRADETDAPRSMLEGTRVANRLQDLLMERFAVGKTGNQILRETRAAMEAEGIEGLVYSHPVGLHGHAAGALIGLWDQQTGVPGRGDIEVAANTTWSIELGITHPVPEWNGQELQFYVEEDALFDGRTVRFLDGRATAPTLLATGGGVVRWGVER